MNGSIDRRWLRTGALLLVAAVALGGWLDGPATDRNDDVFRRALLTLAAARALDAAVSLAQGTEIALQPAGMGLTVSAGELLDPVNDLLEQFSSLMLVATTSLGLQGLLVRASAWWPLSLLLALAALGRLVVAWAPERVTPDWRRRSRQAFVVLLLLRFALPAFALVSGVIFDRFLEPDRAEAVALIEATTGDVQELERLEDPAAPDAGWRDRVSSWFAETFETLDVEARLVAFRDRVNEVVEQVVRLVVVFSLQTILLPLAFLWVLPRLGALVLDRLRATDAADRAP